MAATSCRIYFPPFSSLQGFPSVHWLPNVCLCHWVLMAIPTVTISRFRWAVRPLTFLSIKGINHFTGGFCLRLLVIYNPALRPSRCHSYAPALWPRPLFGSKGNRQERERRYFVLRILPLTYLYPQIHMQSPQNFLSTLLPATSELIPP